MKARIARSIFVLMSLATLALSTACAADFTAYAPATRARAPFPCKVRNVKSGKFEEVSGDTFKITAEAGETCWFTFES